MTRSEFTKIMLDNDVDKSLAEVEAAEKMREATPRTVNSVVDESVDVGNWTAPTLDDLGESKPSPIKVIVIALIAAVVIIGLVGMNIR